MATLNSLACALCTHDQSNPVSISIKSQTSPHMDHSDILGEIEQDNNPLLYHVPKLPSLQHSSENHDSSTATQVEPSGFNSTDLVNSSLSLSHRIKKWVNSQNLSLDIISSERLANTNVIVYLIELRLSTSDDVIIVKRRYSEFKSLRDHLVKLFPTTVVPPIPEKHTFFTYLINSIDNSKEIFVIEVRKRYFRNFLRDIVFDSSPSLRNCPLFHKFLDPNYESCWENAVSEPPVSSIPQNLLLANPNNPTDQNGLYLLMPPVNGYDVDSQDTLSTLSKMNDDLHKLHNEISLYDSKEHKQPEVKLNTDVLHKIPSALINFETNFHHNIRILHDLQRLNARSAKNLRHLVTVLVELGGNLNNFSLQVHEINSSNENQLSLTIERFGSTMDTNFLNFEHFLNDFYTSEWQEPTNQFVQYYFSALQLIKFYKCKLLQFKLLYKLKFSKLQELTVLNNTQNLIKHLRDIKVESPTLNNAIRRVEAKQLSSSLKTKKSWYGIFGGNKSSFGVPGEAPPAKSQVAANLHEFTPQDVSAHCQYKIQHIEKELNKLDQLLELSNEDMAKLTERLQVNLEEFNRKMERKWLGIMLKFVRAGKKLCEDNATGWSELQRYVNQ